MFYCMNAILTIAGYGFWMCFSQNIGRRCDVVVRASITGAEDPRLKAAYSRHFSKVLFVHPLAPSPIQSDSLLSSIPHRRWKWKQPSPLPHAKHCTTISRDRLSCLGILANESVTTQKSKKTLCFKSVSSVAVWVNLPKMGVTYLTGSTSFDKQTCR